MLAARCDPKKNVVASEEEKKLVAYHEAWPALVALMSEYDPVAKIAIIPRGQAGGLSFFACREERLESGFHNRSYLENQMAVALGGRLVEEDFFGEDNDRSIE